MAKELGVNQSTLSGWKREAEVARADGPLIPGTDELKELRREVEQPRMERDILEKKADFFARDGMMFPFIQAEMNAIP